VADEQALRTEEVWAGTFGNEYVDRNRELGVGRERFWADLVRQHPISSALEVGCNVGLNLRPLSDQVDATRLYGVDVNEKALREIRSALPNVNAVHSSGRELPFRDRMFDLVFTVTVLIHIPPPVLPLVMSEVVRCSRRYVLSAEYFSQEPEEIEYRGHEGLLFKRDFGGYYSELFPELRLLDRGFLGQDDGWDDCTWWLFDRE
jgi:spore coat polysaccharide biosynthesis protein SpsF